MNSISVVMPVKNGEEYIRKSLQNILLMIEPNDEVVIINDQSIDQTFNIASEFANSHSQFKVYNTEKSGLVAALNFGVSKTQNDWIARVDVDDVYPRNRLKVQRQLIAPDVVAIFCDYEIFAGKNRNLGIITTAITPTVMPLSLLSGVRTPHPGVLFAKKAYIEAGMYREKDFPAEDLSLWMRMSKLGLIVSTPQVLLNYRRSLNSVTSEKYSLARFKKNELVNRYIAENGKDFFLSVKMGNVLSQYKSFPFFGQRSFLYLRENLEFLFKKRLFLSFFKTLLLGMYFAVKSPSILIASLVLIYFKLKRLFYSRFGF
jgi:glycosyltransferase involved in cell wall biosynthesis